jgi:hypothetical protein
MTDRGSACPRWTLPCRAGEVIVAPSGVREAELGLEAGDEGGIVLL